MTARVHVAARKNIPIRPQPEGFALEIDLFVSRGFRLQACRIERGHFPGMEVLSHALSLLQE